MMFYHQTSQDQSLACQQSKANQRLSDLDLIRRPRGILVAAHVKLEDILGLIGLLDWLHISGYRGDLWV